MLKVSGQCCLKSKIEAKINNKSSDFCEQSLMTTIHNNSPNSDNFSKIMPMIQSISASPVRFKQQKLKRIRNSPELKLPGIQTPDSTIPGFERTLLSTLIDQIQHKRVLGMGSKLKAKIVKKEEEEDYKGIALKNSKNINRLKRIPIARRTKSKSSIFNFQFLTPIAMKSQRL